MKVVCIGLLLLCLGCTKPEAGKPLPPAARPLEGLKLRVAVAGDPALAQAVGRLRGEWNAQTGADFQVEETAEKDLLQADQLPADAVICPSHLMGVLAERGLLARVPSAILRDPPWRGIFDLLRLHEAVWGEQTMAVPFGSPVLCCYYRADLLDRLGRRPPRTWAEYQELARLLAAYKPAASAAWCGTIEPLAPGWAGLTLLARAAPYAKHRDNYSTLFDMETMEPLLSSPPIVRALEELAAAAKVGPASPQNYDPAAARAAFWRGECGMALTWPTAAAADAERRDDTVPTQSVGTNARDVRVGFVELPGSPQVFNRDAHQWDKRSDEDDPRTPLLSVAGRLGVVDAKSGQPNAAFQLLLWLSDDKTSSQVSAASPATTLFRQSNLNAPGQWVEKPVSASAAAQYGAATEEALSRQQWLASLPLPGRADYLAALDAAVGAVVRGEKAPLEALIQADAQWRKITERLGIERQRAAYRHSLGLE